MTIHGEVLPGAGHGHGPIVRIGDTVRRPTGPHTSAVHALLRHLESAGFDGAPRALGIDDQGREMLTFMPGEEGRDIAHDDRSLTEAARLIRRFHDAVAGFVPPAGAVWNTSHQPSARSLSTAAVAGEPIVCHNDLAPYNTIYTSDRLPWALIDWDLAAPGPSWWDVACAAWRFVPLYTDDDCRLIDLPVLPRGPRLRTFCDGYGLQDRTGFLDLVRLRLQAMDRPFARRSLDYLDAERREWERHLL
jgi:aminoglycoside phosphotransferase (APT) family kinase protein